MIDRTPEGKEYLEKAEPVIKNFLNRVVTDNPQACVTGFIFSGVPRAFVKFGNVGNQGEDFVRINMVLASLVTQIMHGEFPTTPFLEVLGAQNFKELNQEDPDLLAEELARQVMTGLEGPEHQATCFDLAARYFQAKYPPEPPKPKIVPVGEPPTLTPTLPGLPDQPWEEPDDQN
jgi:hypothetical protein